jgi:AcrR family transcriptional regulator
MRVLVDDPSRSMQEIADLTGIGRATLYRYFHTREDLVAAIAQQVLEEAELAIAESRPEEGTVEEAMARLVAGLLATADHYCVQVEKLFPADAAREFEARLGGPLLALAERGQREELFDPSLTPRWIISVMENLVQAAIQGVQAGDLARNHVPDLVMKTLLRGIGTTQSVPRTS